MFKGVIQVITFFMLVCVPLLSMAAPKLTSENEMLTHWYQFSFENDEMTINNRSDDGYSNGIGVAWGRSGYQDFSSIEMPSWLRYISEWTFINQENNQQYALSFGLFQAMYTPTVLEATALIEDDRPYAGTLLWDAKLRSYADNRATSLGLTMGVVGPASLAEKSQKFTHDIIGATVPQGWHNQINNEFVFRIEAEYIKRFYRHVFNNDLMFDSSSYSEVGAGNLRSDIGTGVALRIGNMLDQTYQSISPISSREMSATPTGASERLYWQLYSVLYATYLFNDITLNGNTFSDSHSVELINEQLMFSIGVSAVYKHWGGVFSLHRGTHQFKGQTTPSEYGSFTLSYHY